MADKIFLLPLEEAKLRGEYRKYFVTKRENYLTSIELLPELWDCFLRLDEIQAREFADLERLRDVKHLLPLQLFMTSHAQFRVAFELGVSTCIAEGWNIVRSAIEATAHAHKIFREPNLTKTWASKDDGKKEFQAYRRAFEHKKKEHLFPAQHGYICVIFVQHRPFWKVFGFAAPKEKTNSHSPFFGQTCCYEHSV